MQGFLLINKPSGITSFGAVSRIKRLANEKRVGHTGTLDPMATGVLPIFLGRATALSSYLLESEKTYNATVKLGIKTDTFDITGNILSEIPVSTDNTAVLNALSKFKGVIKQTPPIYSAIKKDGVKMYELARKGKTAEIPERTVEIFNLTQTSPLNENNEFAISVTVSKGTYIRSLANDIGEFLGCGAVLTNLERTSVSGFHISETADLEILSEENISSYLKSEETAVRHFDFVSVTQKQAVRFSNGGQLDFERLKKKDFYENQIIRVKYEDIFLGLGFADTSNNRLAVKCVINGIK